MTTLDIPRADLPTLPETVDAWIARYPPPAAQNASVILSRRASARFARIGTWHHGNDGDLHDWVVDRVRTNVVEYGESDFALDYPGAERCVWNARIAPAHDEVVLRSADPMALVEASWRLTFRSAQMMLEATAAAPRLMSEVGQVYTAAMELLRQGASESDATSVAAIQADASAAKLDKLVSLVEHFSTPKAAALSPHDDATKAANASRALLASLQGNDLATVLGHPMGQALAVARRWDEVQTAVTGLWEVATSLGLSEDSLSAARRVVRGFNAS